MWPQGSGQSVWYSASLPVGRICVWDGWQKERVSWERGAMGLCCWTPSGCSPQVPYNARAPQVTAAWARLAPGGPGTPCAVDRTQHFPTATSVCRQWKDCPVTCGDSCLSAGVAGFSPGVLKDSEGRCAAWNAGGRRGEEARVTFAEWGARACSSGCPLAAQLGAVSLL